MNKKRSLFSLALLVLLLAVYGVTEMNDMLFFKGRTVETFEFTREEVRNPLIGFVPSATYPSIVEEHTLVYVDITWRELEPEEGMFDFETIEKENHLNQWRREGKHVVLRLVNDMPRMEAHMDIPDWLYEKTGGDGQHYDTAYGKGYAPNYRNPTFIESHEKAVAALGGRYGKDTFVSFVQLGSLGHWGEWHVNTAAGIRPLPDEDIRDQYVLPYLKAFPHAKLLMRRPFTIAKEKGLGLYNDVMGQGQSTRQWMDWIAEGGAFDQTGEEEALIPMPNAWKMAPVGGEFTSAIPMPQLLTTNIDQTIDMLQDAHASFLGPKIPTGLVRNGEAYEEGMARVLQTLGYRIGVTKMIWSGTSPPKVKLTWENQGIAPMYWDWPVYLYVTDETGEVVAKTPVQLALTKLLPGKKLTTATNVPLEEIDGEAHAVYVGIEDPMTDEPALQLVSNQERQGTLSLLKKLD